MTAKLSCPNNPGRRVILGRAVTLVVGVAALGGASRAGATTALNTRRLVLDNLHTGEVLDVAYWQGGAYAPQALTAINHVLRDHRTGDVHAIEPTLLDLLSALSTRLETTPRFSVISGYRSPASNLAMHERSGQVASGSLHMQGMAIDIRVPGLDIAHIRNAAASLAVGGVGYYPTSNFVHIDVGRVRHWSGA